MFYVPLPSKNRAVVDDGREQMIEDNEPYSFMSRVVDAIWNFLTAVGLIAACGALGYWWGTT